MARQKRGYNKSLTKAMLDNWGITIDWDWENQEWWVDRYVEYRNGRGGLIKRHTHLTEHVSATLHPNGVDKYYHFYNFSVGNKTISIPTARLVYVYFKEDIPEGYEVDHIDDNSFNNNLNNLQLLTPAENKAKRKNKYGRHTPKGDK